LYIREEEKKKNKQQTHEHAKKKKTRRFQTDFLIVSLSVFVFGVCGSE
jgi:cell division protein FtsB